MFSLSSSVPVCRSPQDEMYDTWTQAHTPCLFPQYHKSQNWRWSLFWIAFDLAWGNSLSGAKSERVVCGHTISVLREKGRSILANKKPPQQGEAEIYHKAVHQKQHKPTLPTGLGPSFPEMCLSQLLHFSHLYFEYETYMGAVWELLLFHFVIDLEQQTFMFSTLNAVLNGPGGSACRPMGTHHLRPPPPSYCNFNHNERPHNALKGWCGCVLFSIPCTWAKGTSFCIAIFPESLGISWDRNQKNHHKYKANLGFHCC